MVLREGKGKGRREKEERLPLLHFELCHSNQMLIASVLFILVSDSIWVIKRDNKQSLEPKRVSSSWRGKKS
jgi:hypothetical protein